MVTRRRIQSKSTPSGGGGVSPSAGNVAWGPDFGETAGNDGVTHRPAVSQTFPALAVANTQGVGVHQTGDLALGFQGTKSPAVHQSATVLGAPFWQSEAHNGTSGATTAGLLINKPTGTAAGDIMVAFIGVGYLTLTSITPPSGWTLIDSQLLVSPDMYAYYKVAGASEPASYTWSTTGTTLVMSGGIHRIIGQHATTPINVSAKAAASAISPVAPTVTTTATNCLVLIASVQTPATTATYTAPANWDERWDVAGGALLAACSAADTRVFAAAAATGAQTITSTSALAAQYSAMTVAIAPGVLTLAA